MLLHVAATVAQTQRDNQPRKQRWQQQQENMLAPPSDKIDLISCST